MNAPMRDERGRLLPGFSGNPSGRPKVVGEIQELAASSAPAAFKRVLELMTSADPRIAFAAAQEILNRAIGKPLQAVESKVEKIDWTQAYLAAVKAANGQTETTPLTIEGEQVADVEW